MTKQVITFNAIECFHYYPEAPSYCDYLGSRHRHIFEIRCWFNVSRNDREIEINHAQNEIAKDLHIRFGTPCEFAGMSCEDICEHILKSYQNCQKVEVLEDGYGGASLTK